MSDNQTTNAPRGITAIAVSGFKSIYDEQRVEIRPLTILAGANSSGKSSIMQPLLLMKQTLEAQYDPGVFKLDGPNVWFSRPNEIISQFEIALNKFSVELTLNGNSAITNIYQLTPDGAQLEILQSVQTSNGQTLSFDPLMTSAQLASEVPTDGVLEVVRNRCFLELRRTDDAFALVSSGQVLAAIREEITQMIHLPAVRGDGKRMYPFFQVQGQHFSGEFQKYVPALLLQITSSPSEQAKSLLKYLANDLRLTNGGIAVHGVASLGAEILVGMDSKTPKPMINIADVGFGVSQVLPVLVALLVAEPGQLVYIDQPELHLHPKAQVSLAAILADAANRGVRVVIETHSALLIQGVQTLVAKRELESEKVKLHWFSRDDDGHTTIDSRDLDQYGAYGDWPEDFAETQLSADNAYLDAVEQRQLEEMHGGQEPQMSGD